jgi:hypothetical protein
MSSKVVLRVITVPGPPSTRFSMASSPATVSTEVTEEVEDDEDDEDEDYQENSQNKSTTEFPAANTRIG